MVADLSTETFLLAFRRFAGRRSTPQLMIFDNATTFQAAAEELKTLSSSEEVRAVLKGRLQWKNDLGLYFSFVLVMKIGMCDLVILRLV